MSNAKPRILTGDRPTGQLHLGHFIGSHRHRLALQDTYECFFLVADLHMLTTKPDKASIEAIADNARAIVLDHLAIGIDPDKVTFYLQSAVHEVYEMNLLLGSLVTVERIQQLPTIKDMANAAGMDQIPYSLLGYPVLQSADILTPRGNLVPVGQDNEAHVEMTRQIARRFNLAYGEVFPIPEAMVVGGTLVGTDGNAKMSKSLNNAVFLADDEATVNRRVMDMYTDPKRIRADIPGTVEGNPVFEYLDFFHPDGANPAIPESRRNPGGTVVEDLKDRYRKGAVGDVEVKQTLARAINDFLEPTRERRSHFESQTGFVDHLLEAGTERARAEARETLMAMKKAMGLTGIWNRIRRSGEKFAKRQAASREA